MPYQVGDTVRPVVDIKLDNGNICETAGHEGVVRERLLNSIEGDNEHYIYWVELHEPVDVKLPDRAAIIQKRFFWFTDEDLGVKVESNFKGFDAEKTKRELETTKAVASKTLRSVDKILGFIPGKVFKTDIKNLRELAKDADDVLQKSDIEKERYTVSIRCFYQGQVLPIIEELAYNQAAIDQIISEWEADLTRRTLLSQVHRQLGFESTLLDKRAFFAALEAQAKEKDQIASISPLAETPEIKLEDVKKNFERMKQQSLGYNSRLTVEFPSGIYSKVRR